MHGFPPPGRAFGAADVDGGLTQQHLFRFWQGSPHFFRIWHDFASRITQATVLADGRGPFDCLVLAHFGNSQVTVLWCLFGHCQNRPKCGKECHNRRSCVFEACFVPEPTEVRQVGVERRWKVLRVVYFGGWKVLRVVHDDSGEGYYSAPIGKARSGCEGAAGVATDGRFHGERARAVLGGGGEG